MDYFSCPADYFIILETVCRGGVTETYLYPLHVLYALATIFLIKQSRNMRSSELKGRRSEHKRLCERDQKKSQKLFITDNWERDLLICVSL